MRAHANQHMLDERERPLHSKQSNIQSNWRFFTITNCWEPKKAEVIHVESSQDTWARVHFVLFFKGGDVESHFKASFVSLLFLWVTPSSDTHELPLVDFLVVPSSSYTNYSFTEKKEIVPLYLIIVGFVSVIWSFKLLILLMISNLMSFTASESVERKEFFCFSKKRWSRMIRVPTSMTQRGWDHSTSWEIKAVMTALLQYRRHAAGVWHRLLFYL
jgi:hypothetical protein